MRVRTCTLLATAAAVALAGSTAAHRATASTDPPAHRPAPTPAVSPDATAATPDGAAVTPDGAAVSRDGAAALPLCRPGAGAATRPPTVASPRADARACRAEGSRGVWASDPGYPGSRAHSRRESDAGYHHLGASTVDEWAGVSGRVTVRDAAVRRGTYDFLATRFMVKRELPDGTVNWLEAGWAETGWSGDGRQRIYTYDTNHRTWRFHDAYRLADGDRVWLSLRTDGTGVWQAWLWWDDRWNLLDAQRLPLGVTATVEQYVEVHVDQQRPARLPLPAVQVDNVQLTGAGGAPPVYWRSDVRTFTGDDDTGPRQRRGDFCVDWTSRYDTWSAADCPPAVRPAAG